MAKHERPEIEPVLLLGRGDSSGRIRTVELIRPNTSFDFMRIRRYAYLLSTIAMLLALLSVPIKGTIKLGIDFTGGVMIQVKFPKPIPTEEVRKALDPIGENLVVQGFTGGDEFVIRTEATEEGTQKLSTQVKELLENKVGKGNVDIRNVEMVGPKVGKDLREAAVWATVLALGMLLIYVGFMRFGVSMALGAILCLIHDIVIIYGLFVWTDKEFNLTILAAILTVIGYDVNDTVVVCDRIRENLGLMRKTSLGDILNTSINQTLSRTILTGLATLLVVVALYFLGTNVLADFALALFVGILLGTFSSIFVATPLILAWDRLVPVKRL
ncbi:MAG: protein translocase subunit SecF [Thermodesulfobacteriota bacterium]